MGGCPPPRFRKNGEKRGGGFEKREKLREKGVKMRKNAIFRVGGPQF